MTMTSSYMTTSATPCSSGDAAAFTAPEAAQVLRLRHEALMIRWARALHTLEGSSYALRPLEELHSTCGECLTAYEAYLSHGNTEPLWHFIERICHLRASLHFPPSEITEAFMLFLEVSSDVLGPDMKDRAAWDEMSTHLRRCTRLSLKSFVNTYLIHLELAHSL